VTLPEFLDKLRATPRTWRLVPNEAEEGRGILMQNRGNRCQCPVSSVAFDVLGPVGVLTENGPVPPTDLGWALAGVQMGLPLTGAYEIANASDGHVEGVEALRAQLLEACGLEEKG